MQLRFGNHGWLTPAAPGCSTCVACEMRDLRCRVAYAIGAATASPPWLRTASATAIAHTPAAIDCYTRAGGVSPPWLTIASARAIAHTHATADWPNKRGDRQPAVRSGTALATATWHSSENLRAGTRSGDRQPAVGRNRIGNGNGPHTRDDRLLHKSGERKPPRGLTNAGASVNVSHGWLTPTALGARRYARPENSAICDAQTHVHGISDREPAVAP
jgi:hypothetical protein